MSTPPKLASEDRLFASLPLESSCREKQATNAFSSTSYTTSVDIPLSKIHQGPQPTSGKYNQNVAK